MITSPTGQPSIEVFGILIMEPMVTSTDLLISVVCLYSFFKLRKLELPTPTQHYFSYYFLIMAIATTVSGITGHAFQYSLGTEWKLLGWILSMLAISILVRGVISFLSPIVSKKLTSILDIANILELLVFIIITSLTVNFFFVQIHSIYGLAIIIFPLSFYAFWKTGNKGARIICLSIIFTTLAAIFYSAKISISPWFNHLDMSHTILAVATYFLFRAALVIKELSQRSIRPEKIAFWKAVKLLFLGT